MGRRHDSKLEEEKKASWRKLRAKWKANGTNGASETRNVTAWLGT